MRFRHAIASIGRIGLTVGAAAALVIGLATNAQAATGTFRYTHEGGGEGQWANPPDNVCFPLSEPDNVDNGTDKTAYLYYGSDCAGNHVADLPPGDNMNGLSELYNPETLRGIESVKFTD
ncbi:hypothetical protein DFR70_13010 [Nocardia tenerifensis]|uniref:Peptidase inhibitor family I36 n=1 Tax=Nocardia tenerifensis TaxID=228006 RepID=A0A318JQL1_9NOCA|nr:hypothetical protein [Nocardia tenerifensis]PXX52762.1 hypothetical protein DFR70_13010 [Nocardia tenerifensis]